MNSIDRIRPGTGSAFYQLPKETLIDDHRGSQQDSACEIDPKRSKNSMISEKGDVETVEPSGSTNEDTDSDLLALWPVENSRAGRARSRW